MAAQEAVALDLGAPDSDILFDGFVMVLRIDEDKIKRVVFKFEGSLLRGGADNVGAAAKLFKSLEGFIIVILMDLIGNVVVPFDIFGGIKVEPGIDAEESLATPIAEQMFGERALLDPNFRTAP